MRIMAVSGQAAFGATSAGKRTFPTGQASTQGDTSKLDMADGHIADGNDEVASQI
jgi:hypothetical protein